MTTRIGTIEDRLESLGIILPTPAVPVASYVGAVHSGHLLVVSGQLPIIDGKLGWVGRLGENISVEEGKKAAAQCFVNVLAQVNAVLETDLDRVVRIVRLGGFIASTPEFTQHAAVMNGASDLALEIFDTAGQHARATVGVASLPLGAPVEVEAIFEIL